MALEDASLGISFWSGMDTSGDKTITPASLMMVGNSQSTMQFTFDVDYVNAIGSLITLTVSVPDCGTYILTATL